MSFPHLSQPLPARPRAVTSAAVLMIVTALLGLGLAVAAVVGMNGFNDVFRPNAAAFNSSPETVNAVETTIRSGLTSIAVVAGIASLVLAVLALGVLRGNPGARLGAWVICVSGTLCGTSTVVAAVATRPALGLSSMDGQSLAVWVTAQQSVPGWFRALTGTLSALMTLGYIAVAVLLAVPAAKAFFGRVIQPWQQPVQGGVHQP